MQIAGEAERRQLARWAGPDTAFHLAFSSNYVRVKKREGARRDGRDGRRGRGRDRIGCQNGDP